MLTTKAPGVLRAAQVGALVLALASGALAQQDSRCLGCHPAPGLLLRLSRGEATTPGAELVRFKGRAHAHLSCLACHRGTQPGPHASRPGTVSCESCHLGRGAGGAGTMPLIDQLHARASTGSPACVQCHRHHGVEPANATAAATSRANVARLCARCHESPAHSGSAPQVAGYAGSVHSGARAGGTEPAATCTDCHAVHATGARSDVMLFPARTGEPQTCGRCHPREKQAYLHSVHGVALRTRPEAMPVCTDCHGKHDILRVADERSPASRSRLVATCDRCHGDEDFASHNGMTTVAARTYRHSYHGIAYRYGNPRAPTCASCHSAHGILPASSPLSPTNTRNIPGQCAQCHPGAATSPQIGLFHVLPRPGMSWLLFIIRTVYMLLVFGSFAGFAAYIVFDLVAHRRLVKAGIEAQFEHRLQHLPRPPESALRRMLPVERLQHFLLLTSFITLALTGIALLVPDGTFGRGIILLCGGMSGRAIVHRVAAALMVGNFVFQALWLVTTRPGRLNLRQLAPGPSDLRDLWQTMLLFLGFSRHRPSFGRYGFAEKFEFWALVWGTLVMTLTGLLLAFVGWTLGHAPKWVVDASELIHKWEAILAVGAIAIWHLYHVVWKPGVYPGNRAWITGEISFEQLVLEHPLEYARAMGWLPGPEGAPPEAEASPEANSPPKTRPAPEARPAPQDEEGESG